MRPRDGARGRYEFTNPVDGGRLTVRDDVPVAEPGTGERDPAAEWLLSTTGDGTRPPVDAATGRLLGAGGQAAHEGAAVTTWGPDSGAGRRWTVTDVTG